MGVVLGGFVAGVLQAKRNGNRLESTRGLLLGAKVGVVSSLIVIAFDYLAPIFPFGPEQMAGIDYLNPIPKYIYATIYGIYDGLVDMVARGEADDGLEWPARSARFIILIASTILFGGFGGAVAASTYVDPSIDEQPERLPETPSSRSHVRLAPGMPIYVQPAREAEIYQPPGRPAPQAPAATGTHATAPQPYFDQAAQLRARRRPRAPLSAAPAEELPRFEPESESE